MVRPFSPWWGEFPSFTRRSPCAQEPQRCLTTVSAFAPDPVGQRLQFGDARVLVTKALQWNGPAVEAEGRAAKARVSGVKHLLPVDGDRHPTPDTLDLHAALAAVADEFEIVAIRAEDLALRHFTAEGPEPRKCHARTRGRTHSLRE